MARLLLRMPLILLISSLETTLSRALVCLRTLPCDRILIRRPVL